MTDSIELRGLRVMAYCGILPEEELRRQPFEIDADIDLDLSAASMSDDLASTIDYGSLVERIDRLAVENRYGLLERFAGEIADVLLVDAPVAGVRVTVRKLRPPVAQDLASAGVTIRRAVG